MARFLPIDRDSVYLFPPSVQDWLPETRLARYIANVIESLDLSGIERALPAGLNAPAAFLADTGHHSEHDVGVCLKAGIEPPVAVGREGHYRAGGNASANRNSRPMTPAQSITMSHIT